MAGDSTTNAGGADKTGGRRLLVVSPRDPVPVYTGLLERIYQMCDYLGRDNEVRLVYPEEPTRRGEEGRTPQDIRFERIGLRNTVLDGLDRLIPHNSALRGLYSTHPWLLRQLRVEVERFDPDAVLVEMPYLVPVTLLATTGHDVPIVLSEHNVEFQFAERMGITGASALRLFEMAVTRHVDVVITVSEHDRDVLDSHANLDRVVVAPNGVDTNRYRPDATSRDALDAYDIDRPVLVYHGNLGNAQNREAVEVLLNDIFPRVREALPDAHLLLVGADPPAIDQEGVVATGLVDDLPAHLAGADVATVSLLSGSGTKLKILEYLSSGVPVVATSVGAEGIPLEDGVNAAIEDDWDAFVERVVALSTDGEHASAVADAGRTLATEQFDWAATMSTYDDILNDLLD